MSQIEVILESFREAFADAAEVGDWYAGRINGRVQVRLEQQQIEAWACETLEAVQVFGFVGACPECDCWPVLVLAFRDGRHVFFYGNNDQLDCLLAGQISYDPARYFIH